MNNKILTKFPNFLEMWQSLLWFSILSIAFFLGLMQYYNQMDTYEVGIFIGTTLIIGYIGHKEKSLRNFVISVGAIALISINLYDGKLDLATESFFLKYFLASQSSVMWMSVLYVIGCFTYLIGLLKDSRFADQTATAMLWCATAMGMNGLLVRWHESYLIDVQIGHIPVSSLYEVFILFCLITALIYLHYQRKYNTYRLGFFVSLIIASAVAFLLWYTFEREAHIIQPLVPALNSYWMKIHVPANFIGYGCFAISAMVAVAWLIVDRMERNNPQSQWLQRLPSLHLMHDLMYKSIALGFAFFTIATVLGAMWAAEAWGGYWSWDPKETWALIVWLNYAAWLHLHLSKGMRGALMAWWAIVGLFVTLFAFIGVNMFLSGLHSYGEL